MARPPGFNHSEDTKERIATTLRQRQQNRSAAVNEIFNFVGQICTGAQRDAIRERLTELHKADLISARELVQCEDSLRPAEAEPVRQTFEEFQAAREAAKAAAAAKDAEPRVYSMDSPQERAITERAWEKAGTNG